MVIAVLGWGSLIWNPSDLPLGSDWFKDGPELPIEFARVSKDERLTLVVHGNKSIPVLWAKLDVNGKAEAIEALRKREGTVERHIGWRFGQENSTGEFYECHKLPVIKNWMEKKKIEGVVWTALPSKNGTGKSNNGTAPKASEAVKHLKNLHGAKRDIAFQYIQKTPSQIRTPYREVFEKEFPELRPKS